MNEYQNHYSKLGELYRELGEIDGWICPGNHDFTGWYREKQASGRWDGKGRVYGLAKEYQNLRRDLERVVYATINYAPASWFVNGWDRYKWQEDKTGREWEAGDSPTPGYGDLRAYAPFADIDLADNVKHRRPDGNVPKEMVEEALTKYIDGFADLAGNSGHVYALDSVGGAYVMIAPTATAPIANALEGEERAVFFEDLVDRLNTWLKDLTEEVNAAIPDAAGTFEPDLLNNKNRLYKAPLSVHSSLDGVVSPVDTDSPAYDYTPLDDVSERLIVDAEAWAEGFTSNHRDAVGPLIAGLYPEYADTPETWPKAVRERVSDLTEERKERARQQRELSDADVPDDIEKTDDLDVIKAKIEAIDVQELARSLADEWDTAPGRDPPRFAASWHGGHDSGTSCFATTDKWVDLAEGRNGGGPLKMIARHRGIITHSSGVLRGEDYWKAVNELRKEGYDIPYFTGLKGTHPDYLRLFEDADTDDEKRRQAVRAMRASQRQ